MATPRVPGLAGVLLVLLSAPAVLAEGASRAQVVKAGKAATAFVECKAGPFQIRGTAFCIHPGGIFLTNAHVLRPPNPGIAGQVTEVALVLDSGQATDRVLPARVLRTDTDLDLALVQVSGQENLPTLPLGSDEELAETAEVIAFGFPFGDAVVAAGGQHEHPAISVNTGRITSLRTQGGKLHRIQVDVVLNPGNSGGPVLDQDGKVIGVVQSGVAAGPGLQANTGVNFLIPVSHVARFVARPEITFDPPLIKVAGVHDATEFRARALRLVPSARALDLELVLQAEGQARRTFPMKPRDGTYRVTAVPVPRPDGPAQLRLTAVYPEGSVRGVVEDADFRVGETAVKLSQARRLLPGPPPRVVLREGRSLRGPLGGLDAVGVRLGGARVVLDLSRAAEVRLEPPLGLQGLTASVVARQDGKEIGRVLRVLEVEGVAAPDEEEALLDIEVPALEKGVEVRRLDAWVRDVAVGGGGRYLILHLPRLTKLAVFDVNEARVVKEVPLPANDIKFTAGLDKLVIALGDGTVQRWSLKTFEQELAVAAPTKGRIVAISMWAASQGPVVAFAMEPNQPGGVAMPASFLLTLDKLERQEIVWARVGHHPVNTGEQIHLRTSPDGKSTAFWCSNYTPSGINWIRWENRVAESTYTHSSGGYLVPGQGGRVLFTGIGLFTAIGMTPQDNKAPAGMESGHRCLPAYGSGYYLDLGPPPPTNYNLAGNRAAGAGADVTRGLAVRKTGVDGPLKVFPDIDVPVEPVDFLKRDLTLDKRFHFIPQAKLLVIIPPGEDRLVLYRVDAEAALEEMRRGEK